MSDLTTNRLRLRHWSHEDKPSFAALCADEDVMRFFPKPLLRQESDDLVDKLQAELTVWGTGVYAVEELTSGKFVGAVGLHQLHDGFPFAPCVEVAWRIHKEFWGQGMAPEAARCCIEWAFSRGLAEEIIAMTAVSNIPSERVMKKLGMLKDSETFLHPDIPEGHALCEHVLYRTCRT